jgi:RHS repeat-associated protein
MTDAAGNVVNRYRYDPYGNPIVGTTEAVANPWRYAAGYRDDETGFAKFGARYYDPSIGRWTQQDPSGQDANPYAYVGGDPINSVDPTGLSLCAIKTNNSEDLDSGCVGGSLWKKAKTAAGYASGGLECGVAVAGTIEGAAGVAEGIALAAGGAVESGGASIPVGLAYATYSGYSAYKAAQSIEDKCGFDD